MGRMNMEKIRKILETKCKPKEKAALLVQALKAGDIIISDLLEFYKTAKDPEKGFCMSGLTAITRDNPQYIKDHIDFVIGQIGHKAHRVKWESSETVANISIAYPKEVAKAIPLLLNNYENESTVVRWSAALALTEIAKHNPEIRKKLIPFIIQMSKEEMQNGVKQLFVKALKWIEKEGKGN
jgi:hypothetical protein